MKENHHQEALECLIESENVIRNELATDHPQHL